MPGRHREGLIGNEWNRLDEPSLSLQPVPTAPGDAMFFDSFVPHASKPNFTNMPRRLLYLAYNLASEGDHRAQYYVDKHASFPPDIERDGSKSYVFRVWHHAGSGTADNRSVHCHCEVRSDAAIPCPRGAKLRRDARDSNNRADPPLHPIALATEHRPP